MLVDCKSKAALVPIPGADGLWRRLRKPSFVHLREPGFVSISLLSKPALLSAARKIATDEAIGRAVNVKDDLINSITSAVSGIVTSIVERTGRRLAAGQTKRPDHMLAVGHRTNTACLLVSR